jgi:hypothetical protein
VWPVSEAPEPQPADDLKRLLVQVDWSSVRTPNEAARALRAASNSGPMVDALIEVLDLHPNRGESAECPFWGQQRIDVLDVTILRAIAILPELRSLPPAASLAAPLD